MDHLNENKVTISKVAELCGVSKTTISRFINGKYDNMSPETKERISSVIEELKYHPNKTAQRLKSQRSMLIGCIIADAGSPFSAILLKGISRCFEQAGYQVLFADSRENPARERRAIQDFIESKVDGLLINTTGGNEEFLTKVKDSIPVVLVDRTVEGGDFDSVTSPNFEMSYKITKLLLEMGYESITVMSEPLKKISPRIDRYRGYCAAMEEAGIPASFHEVINDDVPGCVRHLSSFVADNPGKRAAMLCTNGVAALNALMAAASMGIKVGYDFGCCTFDDWNWLQLSNPRITAIQLGTEEKGYKSAKLLLKRIEKTDGDIGKTEQITIDATPIIRNSTLSRPIDA